jgi:acyl carrier protein
MSDLKKRLAAVMAKTMEVDVAEIDDDTDPDTLEAWDSMAHVQLVAELEKEFGVSISPDVAVDLESFEDIVEFLKKQGAGA